MYQDKSKKGPSTPFHNNANNILNNKNQYNNNNSNQYYVKDTNSNTNTNMQSNLDNTIIDELKQENKQLKQALNHKNKIIDDYQQRVSRLERTIQELKKNQSQSKSHSSNNVMMQPLFGSPMMLMNQPQFMPSSQQFFNDFFGGMNNAPHEESFFDPVKEVEDHIIEQLYPNPDNMTYEQLLELEEQVGSVSKGLTKAQVSNLPLISYSKFAYKKDDKCVVCQYDFKNNERLRKLPCTHLFHKECVDEWLLKDKKCPCCKKEVRV